MNLMAYVQKTLEAVTSGVSAANLPAGLDSQDVTVAFEVATSAGADIEVENPDSVGNIGVLKFSIKVRVDEKRRTG